MTYEIEESIPEGNTGNFKTVNKKYYCESRYDGPIFRIGSIGARSLKVSVDASNSSEYTAYRLTLQTLG